MNAGYGSIATLDTVAPPDIMLKPFADVRQSRLDWAKENFPEDIVYGKM